MKPSIRPTSLLLPVIVLIFGTYTAKAQTVSSAPAQDEVAKVAKSPASNAAANVPVFKHYRGVKIGMSTEEVRNKLAQIKEGDGQDFLVFSDRESAQIYYDEQGKVKAISVDYFNLSDAPAADTVLGTAPKAKPDGSMYQLNRYPDAGYWVSYNRTAGDKPIVTITMQKM